MCPDGAITNATFTAKNELICGNERHTKGY